MTEHYRGRSLYWLRTLLGQPARFPTAAEAAENSGPRSMTGPPLGAVVWYETEPYGNCALSLGDGLVLALNSGGYPVFRTVESPRLGTFIGWTKTIGTPATDG